MIGQLATVTRRLDPAGTVAMQGTLWTAHSAAPIEAGETVKVEALDGFKLTVSKVTKEP